MKLVGGRSYQIMGMYLTLIIAYGLIALALAVPLGALAGYGLAWFIASLMGAVLQGFRIIPAGCRDPDIDRHSNSIRRWFFPGQ